VRTPVRVFRHFLFLHIVKGCVNGAVAAAMFIFFVCLADPNNRLSREWENSLLAVRIGAGTSSFLSSTKCWQSVVIKSLPHIRRSLQLAHSPVGLNILLLICSGHLPIIAETTLRICAGRKLLRQTVAVKHTIRHAVYFSVFGAVIPHFRPPGISEPIP
jgi:hypothetical protein